MDDIAEEFGLNNAIVISKILESSIKFESYEGYYSPYKVSYYSKKIPYLSERTVRRCLNHMSMLFISLKEINGNVYIDVLETIDGMFSLFGSGVKGSYEKLESNNYECILHPNLILAEGE